MDEKVVVRGPGEGRKLLVGGGDHVTYKVRSAETGGAYFCFEVSTTPGAGTAISVPPDVPHTFKNSTDAPARLLFVHQPAALEEFFEEFGVPLEQLGERPGDLEPPDFGAMAAALERNGVEIVGAPA